MPPDDIFTPDANGELPIPPSTAEETTSTEPVAETPPTLTRAELDELLAQRDAQWQARLEDVQKQSIAKSDRARNIALNKANAFEKDYAPTLKRIGVELTEEQIRATKTAIIDNEFWGSDPEPPPQAPMPHIVTREEIAAYVRAQGVAEQDFNIEKFAGLRSDAAGADQALQAELAAARKRQAARSQPPSAESQVVQQFGNTAPTAASGARASTDPLANVYDRETLARLATDELLKG